MGSLGQGIFEQGYKQGFEEGFEQGLREIRVEFISNLMKKQSFSFEQAVQLLDIPEDQWGMYSELLNDIKKEAGFHD